MSRSRPSLATALVLLLSAVTRSSCERRLYQIADAPAPSGSLRTNAKQQEGNGALSTTCSFNIKGSAAGAVRAQSLDGDGGSGEGPLLGANITCRGKQLTLIGGPLLDPFSAAFQGVQYIKAVELPGATMVISDTDLAIEDSLFSGLSFFGDAALCVTNSNVTFVNVTFSSNNNSAAGAIYANDTSNITILDSKFYANGGGQGGAISLWNSSLLVNGTTFYRNQGNGAGGAIAVRNASTIQIITSAFTENVAENGGAVYLETCGKASLADNTFTSNRANKQGGGLFQTKCSGQVRTSYFKMNVAPNGASVWQNDCQQIAHTGSRFDNNTAARGSSGIEMNQIAQADVTQCTFTTGRALKGAGLYLQGVTGTIKQCLFESNLADFGGAIFRGSANGVISGNVFNTNRATRIGGAIYDSHAKGDISGNTFAGNTAPSGSAIFRTVSSGDVSSNKRLQDSQVELDNPASN